MCDYEQCQNVTRAERQTVYWLWYIEKVQYELAPFPSSLSIVVSSRRSCPSSAAHVQVLCLLCPDVHHIASGPNGGQRICSSTPKQLHIIWCTGPIRPDSAPCIKLFTYLWSVWANGFSGSVRLHHDRILCGGEWRQHGSSRPAGASVRGYSIIPCLRWACTYPCRRDWDSGTYGGWTGWGVKRAECLTLCPQAHPGGWGGNRGSRCKVGTTHAPTVPLRWEDVLGVGCAPQEDSLAQPQSSVQGSVLGKRLSRLNYKKPK